MKYLLDVNALLAWRHPAAQSHDVFHAWALRAGLGELATCAHSELGFLRISMQAFGYSKAEAEQALEAGGVAERPRPVAGEAPAASAELSSMGGPGLLNPRLRKGAERGLRTPVCRGEINAWLTPEEFPRVNRF